MRRLFWLSVGAAAGYYVARKGTVAVEAARERGLVGNVTLAAGAASRAASSVTAAVRALSRTPEPTPSAGLRLAPVRGTTTSRAPTSSTSTSREARP